MNRRSTDLAIPALVRLRQILLESDMTLSAFLLGTGLCVWGAIAVLMSPADLYTFSDTAKSTTWLFWALNYQVAGGGLMYVAWRDFPHPWTLLVGTHATLLWTWIAAIRGMSSNFTAGVTLNYIVIVVGVLLLTRVNAK